MMPHRRALVCAFACCVLFGAASRVAAEPRAVPEESEFDFGVIDAGTVLTHTFRVRNEGETALILDRLSLPTGGRITRLDEVTPDGRQAEITCVIDTILARGETVFTFTLRTNDRQQRSLDLIFRGTVRTYIEAEPATVQFTSSLQQPAGPVSVRVRANDATPFGIEGINASHAEIRTEVDHRPAAGEWVLRCALITPLQYSLNGWIELRTTHPRQPRVRLPVTHVLELPPPSASVPMPVSRGSLSVTPTMINLRETDLQQPWRDVVHVRNLGSEPIRVIGVDVTGSGLEARVDTLRDGFEYQIRYSLMPPLTHGPYSGELRIRTESPLVPVLTVPIRADLR